MTAQEFDEEYQRRIDKFYNNYNSPIQRQALYKNAMYFALEAVYKSGVDQEWTDEIRSMIKINYTIALPANGRVVIPTDLPDYNHYLFSRAEYLVGSYKLSSFTYSGSGTIVAHSINPLALRTGTKVRISGVAEMEEANGDFYLKMIGRTSWGLYQDKLLTQPVTATVTLSTGGEAVEIQLNDCVIQFSDQKIQKLDSPSPRYPKVQVADDSLYVLPEGATSLKLDYVTTPPLFITQTNGVFDNTFNLETIYPAKFLYQIIGKAVDIFNTERKDEASFMQNVNLEKLNP